MKHLKLFIASLFLMLGMAVHAQQVEITKTDGTVEVFKPNEVDSVVYKPAPKYYYYAGWECPKTEEELAKNGTEIKDFESLPKDYYIASFGGSYKNPNGTRDYYYLVVPTNKVGICDGEGSTRLESEHEQIQSNIIGYSIYKSTSRYIQLNGIILKKIIN